MTNSEYLPTSRNVVLICEQAYLEVQKKIPLQELKNNLHAINISLMNEALKHIKAEPVRARALATIKNLQSQLIN
jgi:hypothetical protein